MRRYLLLALSLCALAEPALAQDAAESSTHAIHGADTAWMLVATALVLLMTPALAFFYGGLVRSKNTLNAMMMSFAALGFAGVLWAVVGYSLAFGEGSAFIGDFSKAFLNNVGPDDVSGSIPELLFAAFQGTFFIITVAIVSGAIVERMKFTAYLIFLMAWSLLVYVPICHWVWGGGWLAQLDALDFAGGAVVHINAGTAALVAAVVLGTRKDYGRQALLPHNVPFVLLGAGLLWFGWFGFNGGSALASDGLAALAFVNTMLAPAGTLTTWILIDKIRAGKITAVGAATGIVVGLVAITPAAGFISPIHALLIGIIAAFPSYWVIHMRTRTRLDDSLDVFGGHGIGGIVGALLTGIFAQEAWGGANGLLFGNFAQLGIQALSIIGVMLYSSALTYVILKVIGIFLPLRPDRLTEGAGMDRFNHGEEAYSSGEGAILILDRDSL